MLRMQRELNITVATTSQVLSKQIHSDHDKHNHSILCNCHNTMGIARRHLDMVPTIISFP